MKHSFTIGTKITAAIAALFMVAFGMAAEQWLSMGKMGALVEDATAETAAKLALAGDLKDDAMLLRIHQRALFIYAARHDRDRALAARKSFAAVESDFEEKAARLQPMLGDPRAVEDLRVAESNRKIYSEFFYKMAADLDSGRIEDAFLILRDRVSQNGTLMIGAAENIAMLEKQHLAEASASARTAISTANAAALGAILIAWAAGVAALLVVRRIIATLREITAQLADGSEQIESAGTQISGASHSLAQSASEQAASLEETAAAAAEITAVTRGNAAHSRNAANLMTNVDARIADSHRSLDEMTATMTGIASSSSKVSEIIKIIDGLAFQTNILALNAAVEAARAGESGLGFAVVANEVRRLAQRSAQASHDTAALIEESIAQSNQGSGKLARVAEVIGSITASAAEVKILIDDASSGGQEQARGIAEISRSVSELESLTQSTAASAEQSAAASSQLAAQAGALSQIVDRLRGMIE